MQMYRSRITLVVMVTLLSHAWGQQPPPIIGPPLADPGPHRIEVRFAIGKAAVKCKKFSMVAKEDGHLLFKGSFKSGFDIPKQVEDLPRRDALELEFKCSGHRWRFSEVAERAFLHGWWWVGTDYPPFNEHLRSIQVNDAIWLRYLIVDPAEESGFIVYKACPAKFKDQKPEPCYEDLKGEESTKPSSLLIHKATTHGQGSTDTVDPQTGNPHGTIPLAATAAKECDQMLGGKFERQRSLQQSAVQLQLRLCWQHDA